MKNKSIIFLIVAAAICASFSYHRPHASAVKVDIPFGDTTGFQASKSDEWETVLLYFDQFVEDSVQFELVVRQKKSKKRTEESFIGTITDPRYRPKSKVVYEYFLLRDNTWSIRVETNGDCYIKQQTGKFLKEKPFVFPFKMRFKNK